MLHEDLTGEDICFFLKENPKTAHIPVVVPSVLDNPVLSDKLKNFHFMPKPFDLLLK
ncbi:hypothetical protein [Pedobacter rhodius]|uniref:Response regulatory domain-containing protein n=1 Tax=Pedobacter rhodius TaxID=3004098 RepID=A0ABT4L2V2_9SPHI|nr:hypothetical protein [Pedobacter sp. SJ11]MCZ4225513.1 hypothetical protein [Pedobacter sp. SJ11]